jgi:hypothetical protein
MTDEWARRAADEVATVLSDRGEFDANIIESALLEASRRGEERMREKAAKLADDTEAQETDIGEWSAGYRCAASVIGCAIRSLPVGGEE